MTDKYETHLNRNNGGDEGRHDGDDKLDILITRLADGDAEEVDWVEFQQLASADHEPWRRLAEEQWLVRRLREGFDRAVARAVTIDLPEQIDAPMRYHGESSQIGSRSRVRRVATSYGGWAAAAMIVLVWAISTRFAVAPRIHEVGLNERDGTPPAGDRIADGGASTTHNGTIPVSASAGADTLLSQYLTSPHVVQELPPILIGNKFSTQGQEITYMRRIIERRSVSGLYQEVIDENGNRHFVPRQSRKSEPAEIY